MKPLLSPLLTPGSSPLTESILNHVFLCSALRTQHWALRTQNLLAANWRLTAAKTKFAVGSLQQEL
jgi:hypothetical protein